MADDQAVHRGAVPPPVDLIGHFRELGRAVIPALFIALLVGCAVFGFRSEFAPKQYAASIVTEIRPSVQPVPGDAFIEQLRAPFMSLAVDENVLEQVLSELDVNWDVATLEQSVQMSPGPSPALLIFTVTAPTPELAGEIARAMVVAVSQASFANYSRDARRQADQLEASIAAEEARLRQLPPDDPARGGTAQYLEQLRSQLTTLQSSGGDELTALSTPEQDLKPVTPQPFSEAVVAALAAFVIALELIVLWRSRSGKKPNSTWARRISYKYHATFVPGVVAGHDLPPVIDAKVAQIQQQRRTVLVLQGAQAELPAHVQGLAASNGHHSTLVTLPLTDAWWQRSDLGDIALGLVLVSTASTERTETEAALRQLAELGIPSALVLQRLHRRRRRDIGDGGRRPSGLSAPETSDERKVEDHV